MYRARLASISHGWFARAVALLSLLLMMLVASARAQGPTAACPPSQSAPEGIQPSVPSPTDLLAAPPEEVVVCVGPQAITGVVFSHWVSVARDGENGSKHRAPPKVAKVIIDEVMGFLISSDWVLGEAAALNIHISEARVRHEFDRIRGRQFPKRREFETFLRQSGQTVADLLLRVRLNLLATRIRRHVLAGHRGPGGAHALTRFVHAFRRKWMAQTYCVPRYATTDCGHVQAPL